MSNERIWTTRYGTRVKIKNMNDDHLVNAYKMILTRGFLVEFTKDLAQEIAARKLVFTLPYEWELAVDAPKIEPKVKSRQYTVLRRPKSTEAKA